MKLGTVAALAILLAGFGGPPKVTRIDPPKRMLFIGNSFTYFNDGVPLHVQQLAAAADKANTYEYRMATISGAYLAELEPFVALIQSQKWDVVVLQGQSTEPIESKKDSDRFRAAAQKFDRAIRESGARTALYSTWAFGDGPEMANHLSLAYVALGDELGALVVPVGLAFERVKRESPLIALYYADGKHPSLEGTYLAACVFYSAFFGRSPEGNTYLAGLNAETAHTLQKASWNTTRAFYSGTP
jgi:hypothetical protein